MANFTGKKRNYIKGSAKEVKFANGGSIVHIDILLEDLYRLPVNKSGYIKLSLSALPSPDKFGNTHSLFENDFVPKAQGAIAPAQAPKPTTPTRSSRPSTNDMPF